MSTTRAAMSHAPRRISSNRVGSKLYSSTGRPTTALKPTFGRISPSYSHISRPSSCSTTRGARSASAAGTRPSNACGGSTTWSSHEMTVYQRSERGGSGRGGTLTFTFRVKPPFPLRSSIEMATASAYDRTGSAILDRPEATGPTLVLADRREEVLAAEVGPQHIGENELRVGELPEQVVGDAVLPRCAHQHVGVRHVRRVEVARDRALVDRTGPQRAALCFLGDRADGVHQLGAPAVVEGERERHTAVRGREGL